MVDKSLILSKIKDYLGIKKESDFAKYLGIKQNTLSSWHSRNTFDIDLISQKCDFLNYDWLLTGNGPMLKNMIPRNLAVQVLPDEIMTEIKTSKHSGEFKASEVEMWKKLYQLQSELMEEVKRDRDRLQKLLDEKQQ